MTDITARLRLIREAVGDTQRKMSKRMGLGVNGWQNYELGVSAPSWEVLAQLRALGFSVEWVVTGEGPMRTGEQTLQTEAGPVTATGAPPPIDAELMRRIAAGIEDIYKAENVRYFPLQLVEAATRVYADLIEAYDTSEERLVGLKGALHQLRRDLRAPASGISSKWSA